LQGAIVNSATTPVPLDIVPPLAGAETITLQSASYVTLTGTATVAVQRNGSNVTGLTALSATTSVTNTNASSPPTLAAGDTLGIVITAASGTGLSVTLVLQVTP
jgi:hypothetical protein